MVERERDDATLRCIFECPVSGAQFEGEGRLSAMGSPRQSMLSEIGYQIQRWVGEIVNALFGSYQAEWMAEDAAGVVVDKAAESSGMKYSDETIQEAVVEAFESVQEHFVWDAANNQWIADDRNLEGDQAGWLSACLTAAVERHGGQVARPSEAASVEGTPEYRSRSFSAANTGGT